MTTSIKMLLTAIFVTVCLFAAWPPLTGYSHAWHPDGTSDESYGWRSDHVWRSYRHDCGWRCGAIAGMGGPAIIGGLYGYPYYPATAPACERSAAVARLRCPPHWDTQHPRSSDLFQRG
jgi:hypothetical protein